MQACQTTTKYLRYMQNELLWTKESIRNSATANLKRTSLRPASRTQVPWLTRYALLPLRSRSTFLDTTSADLACLLFKMLLDCGFTIVTIPSWKVSTSLTDAAFVTVRKKHPPVLMVCGHPVWMFTLGEVRLHV
jgi:hypothetical protein